MNTATGPALPTVPGVEIVAAFANVEDGVAAHVTKHRSGGFAVVVLDTDSGDALDTVVIYPTLERALAAAAKIAG
jgi:hypothetical protein